MSLNYTKVKYKNNNYAVIDINYRDTIIPSIINWEDFPFINSLNKTWKCNNNGFIYCTHTYNNETKFVYLHELIIANKYNKNNRENLNILHINTIGLDNRRDNLIYDSKDKNSSRNFKKKKRTSELPLESGIDIDSVPTYVWYMKPDATHGDRFMVQVGDVNWKTTSSRNVSLQYKLKEAKYFLKLLKKNRPDLFENYSMNGDYTKEGKELLDSFYSIIHKANYLHINRPLPSNNTEKLLKLSESGYDTEQKLFNNNKLSINLSEGGKRRRINNNLPDELDIITNDLPKYCYYKPSDDKHGGYFYIEHHPLLLNDNLSYWQTNSSYNIPLINKYNQLLDFIDENGL